MESITLAPALEVKASIDLPGSKSISNRTLLLAALAHGSTTIKGLLESDDTERMLEALDALGVDIETIGIKNDGRKIIFGNEGQFKNNSADLFLGNAGTAFRPLTAVLAFSNGNYTLSGVPRMHERPIGDLVDALRQAGAAIEYLGNEGFPPLRISPYTSSVSKPIKIRGDVSSQFLTALLMALPLTKKAATIEVVGELISKPYIEITLNLMAKFGVEVQREGWQRFTIPANSYYSTPTNEFLTELYVEGDASSASYFMAAGAIAGFTTVTGISKNSIQGDIKFAEALKLMNADIKYGDNYISTYKTGKLKAIDLDCNHIPDAAMTLAILALFAEGTTTLRNIASWRVKETDRIAAMAKELSKVGAKVVEGADFISITPPEKLTPNAVIDTYDDHRMAMCFSLVCLGGVSITINDPQCVNKTFPDYFSSKYFGQFTKIVSNTIVPVIAIDGPSASGKGTVAQLVAQQLGYHYLDSGALYRIVAFAAKSQQIAWQDETAVANIVAQLHIEFKHNEIFLNQQNVSEAVRTEEMGRGASQVAVHPAVRAALMDLQRSFRQTPGLVADGRDMGTVVFPDANTKIYLTATAEVRAERRYRQLLSKDIPADFSQILQDLKERDARDQQRSAAPLQQAADAELLETDQISIEQAVQKVLAAQKNCNNPQKHRKKSFFDVKLAT